MDIQRVNTVHEDFVNLTRRLDAELNRRYGLHQAAYDQHNVIDPMDTAVVGYVTRNPVACGCFREMDPQTVEMKRMYVTDGWRRQGFSVLILQALEAWGLELGYTRAVLETGKGQPEALGLYKKCGYGIMDNYGPYKGLDNSVCMEKRLG